MQARRSAGVVVRLVEDHEHLRWVNVLEHEHYLGGPPAIGRTLRYVAHLTGEPDHWIGLLDWSEGALRYQARDQWIGWNPLQRSRRRHLVLMNSRLLIRGSPIVANLGSRILGACVRQLPSDWERIHSHRPLLLESFVDSERFSGIVYQAAGWQRIGMTAGYARSRGARIFHGKTKIAFVKTLDSGARALLSGPFLPKGELTPGILLTPQYLTDLRHLISALSDTRDARGKAYRSISDLWTAQVAALISNHHPCEGLIRWLTTIPMCEWTSLGCRRSLAATKPVIPSIATRRRAWRQFIQQNGLKTIAEWIDRQWPGYHTALLQVA